MWSVLDLETSIHSAFKRKANPFLRDENGNFKNIIVMSGWASRDAPNPVGIRALRDMQDQHIDKFISLLASTKLLVGQNIKFDVLYFIRHPRAHKAWRDWVVGGGLVWDLQLAEYMMQGQIRSAHMLSLDDMARMYGEDMKVDEVKLLWEAGVQTEDIDPDLLARYLLGEDLIDPATGKVTGRKEGDIGVTRNLFLKQLAKAQKMNMMRTLSLNMGSLLATIEMELNGMHVDKGLGLEVSADLEEELKVARAELNAYLPADLPFAFNWGNRYHLSPLIFGGHIKYERREYDLKDGTKTFTPPDVFGDDAYAYAQKDVICYVMNDGTFLPCDEVDAHTDGGRLPINAEKNKSGKNAGEYKTKKVKMDDIEKPKSRMSTDLQKFNGFTVPDEEWASSTPGLYSVSGDIISLLTEHTTIPFLKTLGRVSKLSKDLGTYFITTNDKGEQVGMLTLVMDDGLVHHSLNHTSTVTGRFSSSNPNLQNIPKGNKSRAKEVFTSRFPGGKIIQSDFSSLEVYVQANLTKCANLIKELLRGTDMHCLRLSKKEGMDYQEVFDLCKGYKETAPDGTVIEHAAVEEWDYKRTGVKVFSFQLAYGAGAKTIAKATGMDLDDVEALMLAERELFPEIDAYFEARGQEIERRAKPTTQFVMHPANPAVKVQIMMSRVQMPTGKLYAYQSSPSPAFLLKRGITSTFSPTERKNYEVQGEGGEIMKCAMWIATREFYRHWDAFQGKVLLVNTVHDALYADSAPEFAAKAAVIMHACMEAATDFYCHHFKVEWAIAVPSDTVFGDSMAEESKVPLPNFRELGTKYREQVLRPRYMPGFIPPYQTI